MLFFSGCFLWCVFVSQGAPAEHEPGLWHRVLAAKPCWVHLNRAERQQKVLNQLFHLAFLSFTSSPFLVTHFLTSSPLVLLVLSLPALECWQRAWQPWLQPAASLVSARRLRRARLALFLETRCGGGPWEYWGKSRIEEGELFFEMLPQHWAEMLKLQEGRQST